MKKSMLIGAAVFAAGASVQMAAADVVAFPDMTSGGTFTLDEGDTWTNTATASIADNALAVITVNGTWSAGGNEIQLGGVNGKLRPGNELQDVTLNIGSTGVLSFSSMWLGGGWPGNTTDPGVEGVIINMAEGAQMSFDGTGFGPRLNGGGVWTGDGVVNGGGDNAATLWEYFYNQGFLLKDGAQVGSFADNFEVVGDPANAHTLVAIPTPVTVATITPSVTEGYDPLEVVFDGADSTAVGTIINYDWEFGDGNTATGVLTTNTYAVAGDYTAWLTITDDLGNVASNYVQITVAAAVEANITATANGNYAPLEIIFDGAASTSVYGTVTSYLWEFGDGNTAAGMLATNIYTDVGDYTAWLTITDEEGYMGSNSVAITVGAVDYGIKVDDRFDDGEIGSNALGIGSGFVSGAQSGGSVVETNGTAILDSPLNGGRRARMSSNETADTMVKDGASYLFKGVRFALSADDSGDGSTHHQYFGIRDTAGAGDEGNNPEEGFYLECGFGSMSGNAAGTSTFLYNSASNVKTTLANWTFDNLLITDALVSSNVVLDVEIVVTATGWSIDILGDTYNDGSPISFSGTHAAFAITNTVDTGHAFALNQSESPNLAMSFDRVVIEQVQGAPLVVPTITSFSHDGTTVSLSWDSEPGFNYNVLSRSVLAFGGWSTNAVAVPGAGATTSTTVTPSGGTAEFFIIEAY